MLVIPRKSAQESFFSSFLHPAIRGGPRSSAWPHASQGQKRNEEDTVNLMDGRELGNDINRGAVYGGRDSSGPTACEKEAKYAVNGK